MPIPIDVPGSRNAKRYEDVQDLLAAGIHVVTTMNVQHLESLYDVVEKSVGVKVRERLPDSVLAQADQIVNVDLTPEDLQERLREGKVYPAERILTAFDDFFQTPNLENLWEMTLRGMAADRKAQWIALYVESPRMLMLPEKERIQALEHLTGNVGNVPIAVR